MVGRAAKRRSVSRAGGIGYAVSKVLDDEDTL
jgi:hypothetical protein